MVADGSQFLMAYPNATIFLLADGPPHPVAYQDTEHYPVTRNFLIRTKQRTSAETLV